MFRSTRATRKERTRWLPGDGLVLPSAGVMTQAITIHATPRQIWPWLAQMGAGRAGWYSYDIIDNGGAQSAHDVLPALQQLKVGMVMPWLPNSHEGFTVLGFHPEHHLVLGWETPGSEIPAMSWSFLLEERSPGVTRLIVRTRGRKGYRFFGLPQSLNTAAAKVVHFVMQQKQLLGLARRVETRVRT